MFAATNKNVLFRPVISFINGVPESGKDTFIAKLQEYGSSDVYNISSITCIEKLLGIPSSDKTPAARKVKADVGYAMEEYNNFRSRETSVSVLALIQDLYLNSIKKIEQGHLREGDVISPIIFVHAHESFIINRIQGILEASAWKLNCVCILMHRPDVIKNRDDYSNNADKEALDITRKFLRYDYFQPTPTILYNKMDGKHFVMVDNSGHEQDLCRVAKGFSNVLNQLLISETV